MPIEFLDDDEGYLAWVRANPQGFVVNTPRTPSTSYLMLHRATCSTISGMPSNGVRWTGPYRKLCAGDLGDLESWAIDRLSGSLQPCGRCMPEHGSALPSSPPSHSIESLSQLAGLIAKRNEVDLLIGSILGRPVHSGHFGEYVASAIFDIELHASATYRGSDGHFRSGSLSGKSVNIKYDTRGAGLLDMTANRDHSMHADYYLVMTGPKSGAVTSKNTHALWNIEFVYLFSTPDLLWELNERGVGIGVATSVRKHLWEAAEIFPECRNPTTPLVLSDDQIAALKLFAPAASPS